MRFVELKSQEQLDMQTLHRSRDRLVGERTAPINQLRAILLERGIVAPQGKRKLEQFLVGLMDEQGGAGLSPRMIMLVKALRLLKIKHLRTRPYAPRTNGKAERFVQTSLREWAYAKPYSTSQDRAAELPLWLHRYNWHRPHGSIGAKPPSSRLRPTEDNVLRLHI